MPTLSPAISGKSDGGAGEKKKTPFITQLQVDQVSILEKRHYTVLSITQWPRRLKVPSVLSSIEPGRTAVLLQQHTKRDEAEHRDSKGEEYYPAIVPSLAIVVGLGVGRARLFVCVVKKKEGKKKET